MTYASLTQVKAALRITDTADDIPPMFPNWELAELIPQPSELSHIFIFRKAQP